MNVACQEHATDRAEGILVMCDSSVLMPTWPPHIISVWAIASTQDIASPGDRPDRSTPYHHPSMRNMRKCTDNSVFISSSRAGSMEHQPARWVTDYLEMSSIKPRKALLF
ncbi:MAG: hypothetical protein D6690_08515 [Nitrospirae bacterium]|nr:MAG: hypothetical protein D6690_08515 [Nitrospirota bacterium]